MHLARSILRLVALLVPNPKHRRLLYIVASAITVVMAVNALPAKAFAQAEPVYSPSSPPKTNNVLDRIMGNRVLRLQAANDEHANDNQKVARTRPALGRAATRFANVAKVGAAASRALGWGAVIMAALELGQHFLGDQEQAPVIINGPLPGQSGSRVVAPGSFIPAFPTLKAGDANDEFMRGTSWPLDPSESGAFGCVGATWLAFMTCYNHNINESYGQGSDQSRPPFGILTVAPDGHGIVRRAAWYNGAGEFLAAITKTAVSVQTRASLYNGAECKSGMWDKDGCELAPLGGYIAAMDVHSPIPRLFPVTPQNLNAPVAPKVMADLLNKLWSNAAAQPGYDGLPFNSADPVTEAEARAVLNANPALWPSVGELNNPACPTCYAGQEIAINIPENGSLPSTDPGYQPVPGTSPGTSPTLDLGPNPATPQPALETAPSAASIIEPLFSWFPGLTSLTVNVGGASCPTDTVNVLDTQLVLDQHCAMMEQHRALIGAVMLAVWTMAAAVVLLRA
jgi:hypothetical protein